jgi:hypothetical protein
MKEWLSKKLKEWSETGLRLPGAYDVKNGKASVTLMFAWISFFVAIISVVMGHFKQLDLSATWTAIGFWFLCTALYMLRKLQKLKFDADDKSIELDGGDDEEEKKEQKSEA